MSEAETKPGWAEALRVYADRRVLSLLLIGFASGLPLALTASTLSVWLTEAKVDLTTIGLFALVGVPYTFKFLWAPLADRVPLPLLTRTLGRRRGWIVALQVALMAALFALGNSDPVARPLETALLAFLVAFLSASQDIVIDAFRVEILEERQYGAGAAMIQFGYRIGMLVSGAGALALADHVSWFAVYGVMAVLMTIGTATVLLSAEPPVPPGAAAPASARSAGAWLADTIVAPFAEFGRRQGWAALGIIAFIMLFKLGDALAGVLSNPFFVLIGFTKSEIAGVVKVFGFGATIIGTLLGGLMVARYGILKSLFVGGVLQMLSNLMFVVQVEVGPDLRMLTVTVAVENLSGGIGSAAFVAYLSRLCNLSYTATQYALLSAAATLGRTVIASRSGAWVEALGWTPFFLLTTAAAIPGLVLLWWIVRRAPPGD
jgi:PAT family beta-lactamase induction signal transducer AmpG